eukprot:g8441.t1
MGGNLGEVAGTFDRAVESLRQHPQITVDAVSPIHQTTPVGADAGAPFLNAAAAIQTDLEPLALLDELQRIEAENGRRRERHWGPRTLDLDLITYGDAVVELPRLTVPHPACWYRRFVLDPVVDIAPDVRHPLRHVTFRELRERLLPRPLLFGVAGSEQAADDLADGLLAEFSSATVARTNDLSAAILLFDLSDSCEASIPNDMIARLPLPGDRFEEQYRFAHDALIADAFSRPATVAELDDRVGDHHEGVVLRFFVETGDMAGEQYVIEFQQRAFQRQRLDFKHIETGGTNVARLQRVVQRGFVDERPPGRVDQHRPFLHLGERVGVDDVPACGSKGLPGIMSYRLIDIVQQLGHPRILVLGDLILDRYVWGDAERISQEAPVILLREERQEIRPGGAANVANLLRGLDAEVTMAGVVGDDEDGRLLAAEMEAAGVDCSLLVPDASRPTTVKQRFIGRAQHRHPHQMLRVDRESRAPLNREIAEQLTAAIIARIDEFDAVLISDYAKGVCTPEVLSQTIAAVRALGRPVIVDPAANGDYRHYIGATAITPNRLETHRATGRDIATTEDAFAAGARLCAQLELDYCFVTLDSDGIALTMRDGTTEMLSTRKRQVYDITGAGDMVLAMIGVAAAAGVAPADLARLANVAGGLEVEQIGVVRVSRQEILGDLLAGTRSAADKVCTLDELARHIDARRRLGQRVVMTNGCFDVMHVGHMTYLQQAAREGDCLVVAVNSDSSVRQLDKAPDRPVFPQEQRAAMLAALESVDYVVVFDESTPHAVIDRLHPELLVKGGTYTVDEIVGRELVESYGGQVKALGEVPGISTTEVIRRLRGEPRPYLGCESPSRATELATTPADEAKFRYFQQRHRRLFEGSRYVCLNPGGAFGAAKHWPSESFGALARRIVDELGQNVLVLCGPAERDTARDIARSADRPKHVVTLADETPGIGLTKAAIRHAELLVTTDSGPRHFAQPFGVPVVTLFGPTHIAWSETFYDKAVHVQHKVRYRKPLDNFLQRLNPRHRALIGLERSIYRSEHVRRIVTQSQLDRRLVQEYYGIDDEKIRTVYNGVDTTVFHPGVREGRDAVREELSVPGDAPLLVFASMDFAGKGLFSIFQALKATRHSDAQLLVLGTGPIARFQRLADDLGIARRVTFAGRRNEIERYYGAADLFLLPTAYEPFPNVNLEAMACGVPVITTTTSGGVDVIQESRNGYLISDINAVDEMTAHLNAHLDLSDSARARMSAHCWETARGMTIARNVEQTLKLLRDHGLVTFDAFMNDTGGEVAKNLLAERVTSRFSLKQTDGGEVAFYIKRHTAPPIKEYIKPWLRLTRPILGARGEWRAMIEFHSAGIATMIPVALGEQGTRSFVVTRAIDGCEKLSDWMQRNLTGGSRDETVTAGVVEGIARIARTMHSAGLHHQDFYLTHLLLPAEQGENQIHVIDLGRARRRKRLSRRWIVKDLAQLNYSAGLFSEADRSRFLQTYFGRPVTAADRPLLRRIERKTDRIARHSRKNGL